MRKKVWIAFRLPSLAVVSLLLLAGCSTKLDWFGAGGVDCQWDEYDYKAHKEGRLAPAADRQDALRHQAEAAMRQAEEEQKQLEFGACSDSDLANHTCH